MKKIFIALVLICGSSQAATRNVAPPSSAIVTPEIATGYRVYEWTARSSNGEPVVCPSYDWYSRGGVCKDEQGRNRWIHITKAIPPGKTYAGFSLTYHGSVIVYWR